MLKQVYLILIIGKWHIYVHVQSFIIIVQYKEHVFFYLEKLMGPSDMSIIPNKEINQTYENIYIYIYLGGGG